MTYSELEKISKNSMNNECEVCLFGAGVRGKTRCFDFVRYFGIKIDFYCDNKVAPETIIRDGIKVRDIQYLYENKDNIYVFLTVGPNYQKEILDQLSEHGVYNIITIDWFLVSQVLDSIEASGDGAVKQKYHEFYNDKEFLEKYFEHWMEYKIDFNNPSTFNEKIQWLKLYNHKPEYTRMVDKYEMRQFVEERIGSGYTVPLIGVWESFDDIDFDQLPKQFVLKCNHDSGSIVIVQDKDKFDIEDAKEKINRTLSTNYYWRAREWAYKNVKRKIIAEPYLYDAKQKELLDYRFFCFNGEVKAIIVDFDHTLNKIGRRNFYNKYWEYMPLSLHYPTAPETIIEKPKCMEEMIEIAEKLSVSIPHIRIDFYIIDDRPIIGELTFYHAAGSQKFSPKKWDKIFGDWIDLPN